MYTIEVKLPLEKIAAMRESFDNLAGSDGPLEAVGEHIVGEWMPGLFGSSGFGTWDAVLRGGMPLDETGLLKGGFVYSMGMDQKSVIVSNEGREEMIQWVQNYGLTIHAVNGPYLKFKIGDQWVQKAEVTIPARPFFVFLDDLKDECIEVARENLVGTAKELFQ